MWAAQSSWNAASLSLHVWQQQRQQWGDRNSCLFCLAGLGCQDFWSAAVASVTFLELRTETLDTEEFSCDNRKSGIYGWHQMLYSHGHGIFSCPTTKFPRSTQSLWNQGPTCLTAKLPLLPLSSFSGDSFFRLPAEPALLKGGKTTLQDSLHLPAFAVPGAVAQQSLSETWLCNPRRGSLDQS